MTPNYPLLMPRDGFLLHTIHSPHVYVPLSNSVVLLSDHPSLFWVIFEISVVFSFLNISSQSVDSSSGPKSLSLFMSAGVFLDFGGIYQKF